MNSLSKRNHLLLHFQSYLACEANVKPWRVLLLYLNNPTRQTRPWLQTIISISILIYRWLFSLFFRSPLNKREPHFSSWNQRVSRENRQEPPKNTAIGRSDRSMCIQHLHKAAGGSGGRSTHTNTQTSKQANNQVLQVKTLQRFQLRKLSRFATGSAWKAEINWPRLANGLRFKSPNVIIVPRLQETCENKLL